MAMNITIILTTKDGFYAHNRKSPVDGDSLFYIFK